MRRKLLLRKTFLRYFITYSLILLLPIMVLGSFTHLRFVKNMRENAARKQLDSLVNTVDVVDMKWSDLEQFLLQLQSNSLFSMRSLQKDSFQIMKAQNELHTFAISNSFAKDIFFYLRDTNIFFSYNSTYNPDWFASSIYKYETMSDSEFKQLLNGTNTMYSREDTSADGTLSSLFLPFPLYSPSPYATAMITIDSGTFHKICSSQLYGSGFLVIFDRFGNPMSLLNCPENFPIDELIPSGLPEQYAGLYSIDGIDYLTCRADSQVNGWQYFSFVPYSDALMEVQTLERDTILILIVTVLFGAIFIFLFSCYNYNPIHKLTKLVQSYQKQPAGIGSSNELQWVQDIFVQTVENGNTLQQHFIENHDSIQRLLLSSFLHGQIESVEELNAKGASVGLRLSPLPLCVLIFDFGSSVPDKMDWSTLALQVLNRSFSAFCCGQSGNLFIFLLCGVDDTAHLKHVLTALLNQLILCNYRASIGVSDVFHTAGDAPQRLCGSYFGP